MHRREKFCEALEILVTSFFGARVARAKTGRVDLLQAVRITT
jgi:hypothetical protein